MATHADGFVAKLNPDGSGPAYSTYLGANRTDDVLGIAVDAGGDAYLTGLTASTDFPKRGALQDESDEFANAFVAKLTPDPDDPNSGRGDLDDLTYWTQLGGHGMDFAWGIALDRGGSAYVTGFTQAVDFPTTPGSFRPSDLDLEGTDAFVAKLDLRVSKLVYSTYLGGLSCDEGRSIAVDAEGSAIVTGNTHSSESPTTVDAFQRVDPDPAPGLGRDAFVTKLNPAGSALVYSTFLGGIGWDGGRVHRRGRRRERLRDRTDQGGQLPHGALRSG